jgi:hypothetical protein
MEILAAGGVEADNAQPERDAPKLANRVTASGRPKLFLYAMFLFLDTNPIEFRTLAG